MLASYYSPHLGIGTGESVLLLKETPLESADPNKLQHFLMEDSSCNVSQFLESPPPNDQAEVPYVFLKQSGSLIFQDQSPLLYGKLTPS